MKRTLDNGSKSLHNLLVKIKLQNIISGALCMCRTQKSKGVFCSEDKKRQLRAAVLFRSREHYLSLLAVT